jgi:flagellin FlaB
MFRTCLAVLLRMPAYRKGKGEVEMFNRIKQHKGITGLETAIILIAFVIVASVLAYIVISAGLFSSQKAKEAVNSGLKQTGSTVELKGNVVAAVDAASGYVSDVFFTLGGVPGGSAVDFTDTAGGNNRVVISYSDDFHQYPALDWTANFVSSSNGDNMLDQDEMVQIDVDMSAVNTGADAGHAAQESLGTYHKFTLEVKPPDGPVLTIERKLPGQLSQLVNLQ